MATSHYGKLPAAPLPMDSKAQQADNCIRQKMAENEDMTTAAQDCMNEVGMTEEDQKTLLLGTLDAADAMTIQQRVEWCQEFLPHFWNDPSTLDEACQYTAENWAEAKAELMRQLDMP